MTVLPDWLYVVLQALVICWFPGHVQVTRHDWMVREVLFVTVTVATKPDPQSLSRWYDAVTVPVPPDGLTDGLADGLTDGLRLADGLTDGLTDALADADADTDAETDGDGLAEPPRNNSE